MRKKTGPLTMERTGPTFNFSFFGGNVKEKTPLNRPATVFSQSKWGKQHGLKSGDEGNGGGEKL